MLCVQIAKKMEKRNLTERQIIIERQNNESSDIADLEMLSDTESQSDLSRSFRIAEECSDSDESVQYYHDVF